MTKITKIASVLVIFSLLLAVFTACGISEKELIGTWRSNYVYNGAEIESTMTFYSDGTYYEMSKKNGVISSYDSGYYTIEGGKVDCHITDCSNKLEIGSETIYKYRSGKLINNDHEWKKDN